MITKRFWIYILMMMISGLCLLIDPGHTQMIADIQQDIQTRFGEYQPYLVTVTPHAESYTVTSDFSNVVNFKDFTFTDAEKTLLAKNYFVVSPRREENGTGYKEIYDIYNECREQGNPIFITTDAMLHTFHSLYDYALKTVELKKFISDLDHLNKALLTEAEDQYQAATDNNVKEAARLSVALLSIATVLLDTTFAVPAYVDSIIALELTLIKKHAGYENSPLLTYAEDYSQYKARGHYTTEEALKPYFRSMMWLGRATLATIDPLLPLPDEVIRQHCRSALLLVQALERAQVNTEPAMNVWERIYTPTVFFVGKTDDINVYQYRLLAHQVYGENFSSLPVETFADTIALDQFINLTTELPGPKILSFTPKGFRIMGQRFIPDSYVTGRVVIPFAPRVMPRGLDVMAVLGSNRSRQILDDVFHDTDHFLQLDSLQVEFAAMPDTVWAQNLYWNWLYCLMPLLFPKGEGYPPFMQNLAWVDKELYAALGSWTELRHDTILYAKSSMTMGVHPESILLQGYVEPNPHFFARLAALTSYMLDGLDRQNLLFSEFDWRLRELQELLLSLKTIAEKELTNQNLNAKDYELICNIGETIEELVTTSNYGLEGPWPESFDEMPTIADVHTDPMFTNSILEEGVGYPFNLFVICNVAGELVLTRGAGFSYYEFWQPITSGRLTDEEWKILLKSDTPQLSPPWAGAFMDTTSYWTNKEPQYYYWQKMNLTTLAVSTTADTHSVGEDVEIRISSNGRFVSPPVVTIIPQQGVPFDLSELIQDSLGYHCLLHTMGMAAGKVIIAVTAQLIHWENTVTVSYRHVAWLQTGSSVKAPLEPLPKSTLVLQNYPNPFNPVTEIKYALPGTAASYRVTIKIYDVIGRLVKVLVNAEQPSGVHSVRWDSTDLLGQPVASGVYFYSLEVGEFKEMKKMVLLR